jgi:hypothetical protein
VVGGKNYMKIGDGQLQYLLFFDPLGPLIFLALVAVPVPAAIKAKHQRPALAALVYPPAQRWRPASHHGPHYFGLLRADPMFLTVLVPMFPENIGHGEGGAAAVGDVLIQKGHRRSEQVEGLT